MAISMPQTVAAHPTMGGNLVKGGVLLPLD